MTITPAMSMATDLSTTWLTSVDLKKIVTSVGSPVFVYSENQLRRNIARIHDASAQAGLRQRTKLYVPLFPNSNPHLLAPFRDLDVGLLLQMPNEYELVRRHGFDNFIVSPGYVGDAELAFWAEAGYRTFLSSLHEVETALQLGAPTISARIDSLGSGKPGIKYGELDDLARLLERHGRELDCFEVYTGSGNSRDQMVNVIETLFGIFADNFPSARAINFAGGHGFLYEAWREDEKHFDWSDYFQSLAAIASRVGLPDHVDFLFEPARDVLADTGVLVLGIERPIVSSPVSNILVTNGSRMLMPSAQLRDRRHNVLFLDDTLRPVDFDATTDALPVLVRGRTILRNDYLLPGEYLAPTSLDGSSFMAVMDVGAYCATQHMEFLNVPPAAEVVVGADGTARLVSRCGDPLDKWRNLLDEPVAL